MLQACNHKRQYTDSPNERHHAFAGIMSLLASCVYPHTAGGNQFAVADYFLDQGAIGAVHAGGNKRVFVLEVRTCCM